MSIIYLKLKTSETELISFLPSTWISFHLGPQSSQIIATPSLEGILTLPFLLHPTANLSENPVSLSAYIQGPTISHLPVPPLGQATVISLWLLPQPSSRPPCFNSSPSTVYSPLSCQIMSLLCSNPSYACPSHSKIQNPYDCFHYLAPQYLTSNHLQLSPHSHYSTNTCQLVFLQIRQTPSLPRPFHSCLSVWGALLRGVYMAQSFLFFAQMYLLSGADSTHSLLSLYGFHFRHSSYSHQYTL